MSESPAVAAVSPDPELDREQRYVERAYDCLDAMRERAVYLKGLGYLGGNVTEGGVTPELMAAWDFDKQARIDALSEQPGALCFGRIDHLGGDHWYIGRRHVEDADGNEVVTDWRAPVSTPFYRATVADRMGLRRRRRFLIEGRRLVDLFDEDLEHPHRRDAGAYVPDPLLAEISRARTGEMRDIIATIQAEQDLIIRAPIDRCIVVQGGPGTGKTAVGLHRAAFLLYERRQILERQRLLIIGPNKIFLRYISQVLPSLGETASVQLTLDGLVGSRYRLGPDDSPAVARLKGDPRMAEVISRAARGLLAYPTEDLGVSTGFGEVTFRAVEVTAIIEGILGRGHCLKDSRAALRERLVGLAWRARMARAEADVTERGAFESALRSSARFKAALDRMWPTMSGPAVLRRLFGNRAALVAATDGLLSGDERDLLARKPARRLSEERWTRADLALLDEARHVIEGSTKSYGHVVVDEAQDLSAMEMRMVARRARDGSMTLLGDLAQATAPGAQSAWDDAVAHLGVERAQIDELTVGYRVPAPIMAFADRLLPQIAPTLRPTASVRDTNRPPTVEWVAPGEATGRAARVAAELLRTWESVAVVAPKAMKQETAGSLAARELQFLDGEARSALGDHLTLLTPLDTKGLEFDAVVVLEPSRILTETESGAHLLYVVLTRAVQQLAIVTSEPLPGALAEAATRAGEGGPLP
jgi:DNA helicase IV